MPAAISRASSASNVLDENNSRISSFNSSTTAAASAAAVASNGILHHHHRSSSNLVDDSIEPIWKRRNSNEFKSLNVKLNSPSSIESNVPPLPFSLLQPHQQQNQQSVERDSVLTSRKSVNQKSQNHSLGNNKHSHHVQSNFGANKSIINSGSYLLWITPVAARYLPIYTFN